MEAKKLVPRELLSVLNSHVAGPEAIVVTGMRRTGKTTLLRQVFDRIPGENKLFLDLENPLNQKYFEEIDYDVIPRRLQERGLRLDQRAYLFLDEIQYVRAMPSVVKYLSDHYSIKFFLTGSASFYLKNLFTESLVGRKRLFELFPFSFKEFLASRGEQAPESGLKNVSSVQFEYYASRYEEYVAYGGFPEVVTKKSVDEKKAVLRDIFSSYYNKEVLALGDFRNNTVVRDLMLLLLERVGTTLSIQKIASELGVSWVSVREYIAFLEGTYFISLVRPFRRNRDSEIRSAPKIYAIDSGLVGAFARIDLGRIFENTIFSQLRGAGREIAYWRSKAGAEIDFVLDRRVGYEVKLHADQHDILLLQKLCGRLGLSSGAVLSYRYANLPAVRYGFQL